MPGMNPISGIGNVQWPGQVQGPGQAGKAQPGQFAEMLTSAVSGADADQQAANSALQDLLTGKTDNVLPVINAAAKADMSFKLLLGVRNKMIEAYKTTANMQV